MRIKDDARRQMRNESRLDAEMGKGIARFDTNYSHGKGEVAKEKEDAF